MSVIYKAPDNSLHVIEPTFAHLLPAGCVEITEAEAEVIRAANVPVRTQEQIVAAITADIQQRLDAFARTRNYDGILSACTYAISSNPKFAIEGQHCVFLRDATWETAYQLLEEVQTGQRPVPQSIADIADALPALSWPA